MQLNSGISMLEVLSHLLFLTSQVSGFTGLQGGYQLGIGRKLEEWQRHVFLGHSQALLAI